MNKDDRIKFYTGLLRTGDLLGISLKQAFNRIASVSQITHLPDNVDVSTNSTYLDPLKAVKVIYDNKFIKNWTFDINIEVENNSGKGASIIAKGNINEKIKYDPKHIDLKEINTLAKHLKFKPNSTFSNYKDMSVIIECYANGGFEANSFGTIDNAKFGRGNANLSAYFVDNKILMEIDEKGILKSFFNAGKLVFARYLIYCCEESSKYNYNEENDSVELKKIKSSSNDFAYKLAKYLLYYFSKFGLKSNGNPLRNRLYNFSKFFSLCAKYPLIEIRNNEEISENDDKIAEYLKIS